MGAGLNPVWSGSEDGIEPGVLKLRGDGGSALGVSGDDHEFEIGDFLPEGFGSFCDEELLAVVGAPREENSSPFRHSGRGEPLIQFGALLLYELRISDVVKLHTAGDDDVFLRNSESAPAFPVDLEGDGRAVEQGENRFDERTKLEIAFL